MQRLLPFSAILWLAHGWGHRLPGCKYQGKYKVQYNDQRIMSSSKQSHFQASAVSSLEKEADDEGKRQELETGDKNPDKEERFVYILVKCRSDTYKFDPLWDAIRGAFSSREAAVAAAGKAAIHFGGDTFEEGLADSYYDYKEDCRKNPPVPDPHDYCHIAGHDELLIELRRYQTYGYDSEELYVKKIPLQD
jgi:hypothetical protein